MQLIDNKCPNCLGMLRRVDGAHVLECESCGSRFAVSGSVPQEDESPALKDANPADIVALLTNFAAVNGSAREKHDFVCGESLAARRGRKKLANARRCFEMGPEVPDSEVRVLLDTTLMGSGKVGFACCDKGWYCNDEVAAVAHLTWKELAAEQIRRDGPNILVGEYKFIVKGKDARQLLDLLKSIQALFC